MNTNTTLQRRRIDVTITLGEGHWGETLGDTMTLTGYRVRAEMQTLGGPTSSEAHVRIFGLPVDTLNRVTRVGPIGNLRVLNRIQIAAGADGDALSTFFTGCMVEAYAQMNDAPNTCLNILGLVGADIALKPVAASSYVGPTQVSAVMSDFAKEAGYAFEDGGVQVVLSNPYFPGTTLSKIRSCARAAGILYSTDNNVLAIWPMRGSRVQQEIPVISPNSGMLGYPTYSTRGVTVRTLADSQHALGKKFTVAGSALTPANNTWRTVGVQHTLESQTPNGAWFTDVTGSLAGI